MLGQWRIAEVQDPHTGAVMGRVYSHTKAAYLLSCAKQLQLVPPRSVVRHHAETPAESVKCRCMNVDTLLWQESSSASDSEADSVPAAAASLSIP